MAVWPGDPDVACEALAFGRVRVSRWTLGSHTGTHVDAPVHFSAGPQTVDELDPAVLLGPCRVLDCGEAPVITTAVLSAHDFAGIERLLLRTRNSRHWQEHPRAFDDAFVGLDAGAARLLVAAGVRLLGIDGLSVEAPGGEGVHDILLRAGVIIVEGLNLAAVPAGKYRLVCAPLRLAGADGAPARVLLED